MDKLYLWINIASIVFPLALSFDKKVHYYKKWKFLFPAIILTAIPFVLWDMIFTMWGVWGFNETYLTGIALGNLPLEEVLFFITVPYSSVFIYECLISYTKKRWFSIMSQQVLSIVLASASLVFALLHHHQVYTFTTFLSLGLYLLVLAVLKKPYLIAFFIAYAIVFFPFFLVNGVLTGSWIPDQIVWYNDHEHLGIRLGTIPIVDFFYGMLLILMNVSIYEYLKAERTRKLNEH